MEELDLVYEPAYEGSKEHLELELSRRLSSEGRGPVDGTYLSVNMALCVCHSWDRATGHCVTALTFPNISFPTVANQSMCIIKCSCVA